VDLFDPLNNGPVDNNHHMVNGSRGLITRVKSDLDQYTNGFAQGV
jgi:hypothetical protein